MEVHPLPIIFEETPTLPGSSSGQPPVQSCVSASVRQWILSLGDMVRAGRLDDARRIRIKIALESGIVIDVERDPVVGHLHNTSDVKRLMTMCKERVRYYMDIGAVEMIIGPAPAILQPLHVVSKAGKKHRLVLDLSRNLNDLVGAQSFQCQTFQDAVEMSSPVCFYGKMDLADCFLSFDIHPDSRRLLAFELDGSFYRFKRMPFGWTTSPFWCDEFLSVLDWVLESRGVKHVRFCDDFLFIGDSRDEVRRAMAIARAVLTAHGLVINEAKTEGPSQSIIFLGLGLDSVSQVTFVPSDKIADIKSLIGKALSSTTITRRSLQSLTGKFSFVAAALPGSRPFFRHLIDAAKGLASKHSVLALSVSVKQDLRMWLLVLERWNNRASWVQGEEVVITHDASKEGFGFFLESVPEGFECTRLPELLQLGHGFAGCFATDKLLGPVAQDIQYAELFAIACSLALYGPYLRNSHVLVRTDNIVGVYVINRQSTRYALLLPLLRAIYSTCAEYNMSLRAEHVAGVENDIADWLSRPLLHAFRAHISFEHTHMHVTHIHSSMYEDPAEAHLPALFSLPRS